MIKGRAGFFFRNSVIKTEARNFIDWVNQHFPQVSINLYSGKDWMTDRLDQWSQRKPGLQGKNLSFFPIGSFTDATKPLHNYS